MNGVTNTLENGSYVYVYDGSAGMNGDAIYPMRLPSGLCINIR